jgi:hypothetical protein
MGVRTEDATQHTNQQGHFQLTQEERDKNAAMLDELNLKIETWMKIATKHRIDISEEEANLDWLQHDVRRVEEHCPEALALLRVRKIKSLLVSRIVRKVVSNFHRDVDGEKLIKLKDDLYQFTNAVCIPWFKAAREENVDNSEESLIVQSAILSEMGMLQTASDFQKEVIFRRQLLTRQITTSRVIQKVFRSRIDRLADQMKSVDWFNEERQRVVEGIRLDAQRRLPSDSDPGKLAEMCRDVFEIYHANLELYDQFPEVYGRLADREWYLRSVDDRADALNAKFHDDLYLKGRVEQLRQNAKSLIDSEGYSENLLERVNSVFDALELQASLPLIKDCGFNQHN